MGREIWVAGYPSYLGGADTELSHQIDLWRMHDVDVHLVPMYLVDPKMKQFCDAAGCHTHLFSQKDFPHDIFKDKIVVSFCNGEFLTELPKIVEAGKPRCVTWMNCVPADAIISGREMKRASDVKVGDSVYGHDGKLHRVVNRIESVADKPICVVHTIGLQPIRLTADHRLLVYERFKGILPEHSNYQARPKWKNAVDIQAGDYLVAPKILPNDISTPIFEKISHHNSKWQPKMTVSEDVAWLFGIFVGDGYASRGRNVSIALSSQNHVDRACKAFEQLGVTAKVKCHAAYTVIRANSTILADSFLEWFGSGSENKRLPAFLFNGEWDQRAILEGLIDSDGCRIRGEARLSTVSKSLMLQSFNLAVNCNLRPTVYEQKRGAGAFLNAKTLYVVRWVDSPKKAWKTRWQDNNYCLPVTSITKEQYSGKLVDFEVEDSHSFIVDGVAAHNCMTWTFPKEIEAHKNGWIDLHAFQTDYQRNWIKPALEQYRPVVEFPYRPYFNLNSTSQPIRFQYRKPVDYFALGRISRDDAAKFSDDMWRIFDRVITPNRKKVFVLGFGPNAQQKCKSAPNTLDWQTWNANAVPASQVYGILHCMVHKTGGSRENLPRILFEAWGYGVPLICEDDYGFVDFIENGVNGYRCKTSEEMSYRASELAFNEDKRHQIIMNAYARLSRDVAHPAKCWASWEKLFKEFGYSNEGRK